MAHWSIGQDCLVFSRPDRKPSSLDDIEKLIDWQPIAAPLAPLYAASKGEAAWPPLTMFRAMLLAVWYDVSDGKLAKALDEHPFAGSAGFPHTNLCRSARPSCGSDANWLSYRSTGSCLTR
ncbi:transposase (plasmid) [Kozakia baliensis]|uniref:transposase n=1 Tax=Kozakia baliensis TaxID=153496 RepID=UPI00345C2592